MYPNCTTYTSDTMGRGATAAAATKLAECCMLPRNACLLAVLAVFTVLTVLAVVAVLLARCA